MAPTLSSLVDDILIHILKALAVSDVLNLRLTSKRLESLSRLTNVWYTIFVREVLSYGRPIPGYSIPRSPLAVLEETEHTRQKPNAIKSRSLLESADLEARTLLALRLDKRWCKSGASTPNAEGTVTSTSFDPSTVQAIVNMFLLPGGRYLILAHSDGLRLWDLGFSASSAFLHTTSSPSMMETWLFENPTSILTSGYDIVSDKAAKPSWGGKGKFLLSYSATTDGTARNVSVVSLIYASLKHCSNTNAESDSESVKQPQATRSFNLERTIIIPTSLPPPRDSGSPPNSSANYGTLGRLIEMHSNFLLFECYAPAPPVDGVAMSQYVGIEVLDWMNPDPTLNSTLLVYPGSEVGTFVDVYIQECTQHVIVVWSSCIGVYQLRETTDNVLFTPGRVVSFPTIIFALAEEVTKPIAFTPCVASKEVENLSTARFANLTIVAQPSGRPRGTVQSILTTRESASSSENVDSSVTEYSFRLTRVPTRERNGGASQMLVLAMSSSGRGLRLEDDGSLYCCLPSRMLIPSLQFGVDRMPGSDQGQDADDFSKGLVKTVDFWPYRKVGDVAVESDATAEPTRNLALRFDDGMGRAVYAHIRTGGAKPSPGPQCTVTVLDFA